MLPDGRVAFIDFGIVSSISPVTWKAVEALVTSIALADYETMARALATIGKCVTCHARYMPLSALPVRAFQSLVA